MRGGGEERIRQFRMGDTEEMRGLGTRCGSAGEAAGSHMLHGSIQGHEGGQKRGTPLVVDRKMPGHKASF